MSFADNDRAAEELTDRRGYAPHEARAIVRTLDAAGFLAKPERVQPDVETVAKALHDHGLCVDLPPTSGSNACQRYARAVLALFSEQPTVAQVKAGIAEEIGLTADATDSIVARAWGRDNARIAREWQPERAQPGVETGFGPAFDAFAPALRETLFSEPPTKADS